MHTTAAAYGPALAPVVKGNGYGLGRAVLHGVAATFADNVCVGTVHELDPTPAAGRVVVLTPHLGEWAPDERVVSTVDHPLQLRHHSGRVLVKLASSMRRYGVHPGSLDDLLAAVRRSGAERAGYALHLPLAGTDADRVDEIEEWLRHLPDDGLPLWISHLQPGTFRQLADSHRERSLLIRVGTGLWHGAARSDYLHLGAPVLHTERILAGQPVGYRLTASPSSGTVLCIGAGSAHGVALLDHPDPSRRSPFHFARHRIHALERPHMHTSMCIVPDGQPCPQVGDWVDVQQPFINVHPDEIDWQP